MAGRVGAAGGKEVAGVISVAGDASGRQDGFIYEEQVAHEDVSLVVEFARLFGGEFAVAGVERGAGAVGGFDGAVHEAGLMFEDEVREDVASVRRKLRPGKALSWSVGDL